MAKGKKIPTFLHYDADNALTSGVGSGAGLEFVNAYFPEARETIRISSGYFQLTGFELARKKFNSTVQLRILVRGAKGEGKNVQLTAMQLIEQMVEDLGQCQTPLVETVRETLKQMNEGRFFIRDAREIEPFHCKFYICDELLLWQGSANFTKNGLCVNAEQVSLIRNKSEVLGFIKWFDAVSANARDLLGLLKDWLEKWLGLADPFDVYLKTLFLLFDNLAEPTVSEGANSPAYFQKGVIGQALRQIENHGGALVVAATGLGKTIIGSEIAARLVSGNKIKQVILLAPYNVFANWDAECKGLGIHAVKSFNIKVPFLEISKHSFHQINQLINELKYPAREMLIIVDEVHAYRNQLLALNSEDKNGGKKSRVYDLLNPIVKKGAKIVLLTATAYSTSPQNMNSLLYLLPHKDKRLFSNVPWRVDLTDEFPKLPVVTTLGLPHVLKMARERGDVDENNRVYIQLADTKRYLPKSVVLHRTIYALPLRKDLQTAFDQKCFDHSKKVPHTYCDSDSVKFRKGMSDSVFNSSLKSWLSSPVSIKSSLALNLRTEGEESKTASNLQPNLYENFDASRTIQTPQIQNGDSFKGLMILPLRQRKDFLDPICKSLEEQAASEDKKFSKLKTEVQKRCVIEKGKVIVFVNRFSTAIYLAEELERAFGKRLNIGCTVERGRKRLQLKSSQYRAETLQKFSPKSHNYSLTEEEYNLLICTDADGVGVNLQDANTLVNYDPPLGADVLFQRVGRILRMTDDAERIIHIYTFLPSIVDEATNGSNVQKKICDLFERLRQRQEKSGGVSILGTKILSPNERDAVTLDTDSEIEELLRESEEVNELDSQDGNSYLRHISLLEKKGMRERAENIRDFIYSARGYAQSEPRMFVLLKHGGNYYPVLYNISRETIELIDEFETLDLLECDETEEKASISIDKIESEALKAVEAWRVGKEFSIDDITRICGLYLTPTQEANKVKNIFGNLNRKK